MAEDVVIRYRAEVDDLVRQLERIEKAQEEIIDLEKEQSAEVKKSATSAEFAAKKRKQLLESEQKELIALKKARDLAFDPKKIDEFNKKIRESEKNIGLLTKQTTKEVGSVQSLLGSFATGAGAALAAAFSVDAIIQFGKASVDAFLDAEKNAERLKFAITSIGGESEAQFERLIKQSAQLQQITVFSDDSIQQAQAALSAFGLTADEIEKTIPLLADFATVTGTDIAQAAQQLGSGLEGAGREFKKYGIEVSATASRQQNLNSILQGFGIFAGSAEAATKTLSGQLAQLNNRSDELQETLGSKLAPVFVGLKVGIFEVVNALVDLPSKLVATFEALAASATKGSAAVKVATNTYSEFEEEVRDLISTATTLSELEDATNKARVDQTKQLAKQQTLVNDLLARAAELRSKSPENEREAIAFEEAAAKIRDTNLQNEINKLNLIEKISAERAAAIQKRLNEESEASKKNSDIRVAGSAQEVKEIERLTAKYRDLFNLFNLPPERRQLIDLSLQSNDIEQLKIELAKISAENKVEIPVELTIPDDKKNVTVITKGAEELGKTFIEKYQEELQLAGQIFGELTNLYATFTNAQIADINREKEARLAAIDEGLKANEDNLSKRRISEEEAARVEKELLADKVKAEEQAVRKERELKRKQAIADKAAALVTIAIQTAINVAKYVPPNPLIALAIALGAAQAAIVAAQPIPYKKGTKSAKGGLSRVGEEGEEIMYVPKGAKVLPHGKTNRYGEVLDSMFDGRFDEFVNRKYIAPALVKERKRQAESFAINVARSAQINPETGVPALSYYDMEQIRRKGTRLTDDTIDRLADAITRRASNDIYRR
jgi:hypothetical protein